MAHIRKILRKEISNLMKNKLLKEGFKTH